VSPGGNTGSGGAGEDCRTRKFIAKFELVVAFDAAPVAGSGEAEVAPVAPAEQAETTSETSSESSESSEGG